MDSAIVCRETAGDAKAVCRRFTNRWPTTPLQVAERLRLLEPVQPPRE